MYFFATYARWNPYYVGGLGQLMSKYEKSMLYELFIKSIQFYCFYYYKQVISIL